MLALPPPTAWCISTSPKCWSPSPAPPLEDIASPSLCCERDIFPRLPPEFREPSIERAKGKGLWGWTTVSVTPAGVAAPCSRPRLMASNTAAVPRLQGRITPLILHMTVPEREKQIFREQCAGVYTHRSRVCTSDYAAGFGRGVGDNGLHDGAIAARNETESEQSTRTCDALGGWARCCREGGDVHVRGNYLLGKREAPLAVLRFADGNVGHTAPAPAVQVLQLRVDRSSRSLCVSAAAAAAAAALQC